MNDQEFDQLKRTILALTKIDLDSYKSQQMRRRLQGFIAAQDIAPAQYCRNLEHDRDKLRKLTDFLTINVSEFFRDAEQFHYLKTTVLPVLLARAPMLNIWSAGCSHGAEAYSVAILLEEVSPGRNHRILATDLDENILARAKQGGPYLPADVRNIDKAVLLKYFTRSDDGYRVVDSLRRKVQFRRQDLLRDPFETGFDLISCRNVVIYFTDTAKESLMIRFNQSLKNDGVLFIGATETLLANPHIGMERITPCFYRRSVRRMEEVKKSSVPIVARSGV